MKALTSTRKMPAKGPPVKLHVSQSKRKKLHVAEKPRKAVAGKTASNKGPTEGIRWSGKAAMSSAATKTNRSTAAAVRNAQVSKPRPAVRNENVEPGHRKTDLLTFEELRRLLDTDVSQALIGARRSSKKLTTMRYQIAAIGVGIAYRLAEDFGEREHFYQQPFWHGRMRKPNPKKLLLHCVMAVYGSCSGSEAKRAGDHARALQSAYEAKTPVADIPAYIKKSGGFDGLLNDKFDGLTEEQPNDVGPHSTAVEPANEEQTVRRSQKATPDEEDRDDTEADDVPKVLAPRPKGQSERTQSGGGLDLSLTPIPRSELIKLLAIEANQPLFDQILNMKAGSVLSQLSIKRLSDSLNYSATGNHVPFKRFKLVTT